MKALLAAIFGAVLIAEPASPVKLDKAAAAAAIEDITKDRADTEAWLKSDISSYLATVDRQANEEFFRDSRTRVARSPSAATCFDMVRRHETRAGEAGARQRIEDPPAVHVENYEKWIRRLVESRQLVARDSTARIPLRLVPPTVLRVVAAWLH